jgi:hypothetical protein
MHGSRIPTRKNTRGHHLAGHGVRARLCDSIERKCKISGFFANRLRKLTGISTRPFLHHFTFSTIFSIDHRAFVYIIGKARCTVTGANHT